MKIETTILKYPDLTYVTRYYKQELSEKQQEIYGMKHNIIASRKYAYNKNRKIVNYEYSKLRPIEECQTEPPGKQNLTRWIHDIKAEARSWYSTEIKYINSKHRHGL